MDKRIVVGVDDSASAWIALDWAIAEARHTGRSLAVCHAISVGSRLWARMRSHGDVMTQHDRAIIDRGVRIAAARMGLDRVTGVMPTGDPVEALAKLSGDAEMAVVGLHRHTRPIAELWGETALGTIAEAGCPVVIACPEPAGSRGPFAGHVVVGVDDTAGALGALAYGFAYAARHELPLAA
jgi:nucleotide-binding universal stress UspA family protein